jgi:hypothetical protein
MGERGGFFMAGAAPNPNLISEGCSLPESDSYGNECFWARLTRVLRFFGIYFAGFKDKFSLGTSLE